MKTIIVFGACSAIAQATERLWAQQQSQFVLIDKDEQQLRIVADDLKTRGAVSIRTIATDLTDLTRHQSLVQQAIEANAANEASEAIVLIAYGTLGDQKLSEQDFAVAYRELLTNCVSVISLLTIIANEFERKAKEANAANEANKLTIAVISSVAGDRGRQSNYVYGTAKGALTIFLQGLRNRLANSNIHVLTIKPGFVDTPMTTNFQKGLLWVKPEVIGRGIVAAVEKKKDTVYLPWFWRYIMLIIRAIPERVFKHMKL